MDGKFLTSSIDDGTLNGIPLNQEGCPYSFHVYPTSTYADDFITKDPLIISLSVAAVFLFTIMMFLTYDRLVERRQRLILSKAIRSMLGKFVKRVAVSVDCATSARWI